LIQSKEEAHKYLAQLLSKNLMNRLMTLESDMQKRRQDKQAEKLAEEILLAPDQFTAACIIKDNAFYSGRGDFSKVLDILANKRSNEFMDLANKLVLIKTGYLYRHGVQPDVNEDSSKGIISHDSQFSKMPEIGDRLVLFSDKKTK
jgi:hypothetical protein